jgi:glycosyltransferase involved in cell wall biosynthesis
MSLPSGNALRRVAVLGNHTPRKCGIATFTEHLADALRKAHSDVEFDVLVMSDRPGYRYPAGVRYQIPEQDFDKYPQAATFLNLSGYDVLCVQHEYGIFGGEAGAHLLALLREVKMPIVTTLHTVLRAPSDAQRSVMEELLQLSEGIIVMTQKGAELLKEVHGVSPSRIRVIPHGVPSVPEISRRSAKEAIGIKDRPMVMTFGLLSPDKGIERVIRALPQIAERVPDVAYVVVGATHPNVKASRGEAYRQSLHDLAKELGVHRNLKFIDKFIDEEDLVEMLCAADVYITPYQKAEQITSGTLAYAVGMGRAVISTPYWHAEELLADGRGILVPFDGVQEIGEQISDLLTNPERRAALQTKAAEYGRQMIWSNVAVSYVREFSDARRRGANRLRAMVQPEPTIDVEFKLPRPSTRHLLALTDDTGMFQHAKYMVPNREHGYCTDDNARALFFTCVHSQTNADNGFCTRLQSTYLSFLMDAFNPETGRFRNFMSFNRNWLEDTGSEDSHGRALWCLGAAVARISEDSFRHLACELFTKAIPATVDFTSPRAWAYSVLGACEFLDHFPGHRQAEQLRDENAEKLCKIYLTSAAPGWPWFEQSLAYCNSRLSQALIESGRQSGNEDYVQKGLNSLTWLAAIQRSESGQFAPIGTNGFYVRNCDRAEFDQQPVDAWATISACISAYRISADPSWKAEAWRAFRWFLGENAIHQSLVDHRLGTCRDGLHFDRVNLNCGAESTLSYLCSVAEMRLLMESARTSGYKVNAR